MRRRGAERATRSAGRARPFSHFPSPMTDPSTTDTSVKKIDGSASPTGEMGQTYLASGTRVAMRRWEEPAGTEGSPHTRPYETVGYVVQGRVEIDVAGSTVVCGAGDSYLVPEGAERRYRITEDLVAVEATSPPARVNDRDDASAKA